MGARYQTVAGWANEFGWTLGAELGVSDGVTHIYLLERCPHLHLIGVDVWDLPNIKAGKTIYGEYCECRHCLATRRAKKGVTVAMREARARAGVARLRRSTLHKMSTVAAADLTHDGSLDFVFIDADHSKEGVSGDIGAWRQKLNAAGRMSGHDWNFKSVREGVLAHYAEADIRTEDDHVWWVARP